MRYRTPLALATIVTTLMAGSAIAQDGPNLLPNPDFDTGIDGYSTFGNAFLESDLTYEFSPFSLKMYGCFCGKYNAAGALSDALSGVTPGEVYRVSAYFQNPSWDSILGTSNWSGVKIEFLDAANNVIGLAEERVLEGIYPTMVQDEWVQGNFLCVAPEGTVSFRMIPLFLQSFASEGGAVWADEMSVALSQHDPINPLINGSFDRGVDWGYQIFPYFNGWAEQYGNIFFDDYNYLSPPFAAGLFGSYTDNDGDGECDSEGVSGLNQRIPNITEGQNVSLETSTMTPEFDTIMGTGNYVIHKIEFFGSDPETPIEETQDVILIGTDDSRTSDVWYSSLIETVAPPKTESMRVVVQIVQPNCEDGSIRIDNVLVTVDGEPPAPECAGDFNNDGKIDGADFGLLLSAWGACPDCVEDMNSDNVVNGADVGLLLALWGDCPDDPGGGDEESNCDVPHDGPGCDNAKCEAIVCEQDPICCVNNWDQVCADLAAENCDLP
ncbi:MAG: hypothetical protein MK085_07275 [Phycisphaerales bacterium]|nr:hypothetical protein [Phycisphaerales bacterium]